MESSREKVVGEWGVVSKQLLKSQNTAYKF